MVRGVGGFGDYDSIVCLLLAVRLRSSVWVFAGEVGVGPWALLCCCRYKAADCLVCQFRFCRAIGIRASWRLGVGLALSTAYRLLRPRDAVHPGWRAFFGLAALACGRFVSGRRVVGVGGFGCGSAGLSGRAAVIAGAVRLAVEPAVAAWYASRSRMVYPDVVGHWLWRGVGRRLAIRSDRAAVVGGWGWRTRL